MIIAYRPIITIVGGGFPFGPPPSGGVDKELKPIKVRMVPVPHGKPVRMIPVPRPRGGRRVPVP